MSFAFASLAALLFERPALADPTCTTPPPAGELDPECDLAVGTPLCFVAPNLVPGLYGMPTWPASAVPDPEPTSNRPEISEPRWSSSPLQGFAVQGTTQYVDQARFRIVVDSEFMPTQAAVSIQLKTATNAPTAVDYLYFGLAKYDGSFARGVRIPLGAAALGPHVPIADGQITAYDYNVAVPGWGGAAGRPTWLSNASMWRLTSNNALAAVNGARLAAQFKINLLALGFNPGDRARVMMGIDSDFGSSGSTALGRLQFFIPNLSRCGGGSCTLGDTQPGLPLNPFLAKPAQWTPVNVLGTPCEGIAVNSRDISTTLTCGPGNSSTNCVTAVAGQSNTFEARPDVPAAWATASPQKLLDPGELEVQFKMSNWGSVANPAQWLPLIRATNTQPQSNDLESFPIRATCAPNAAEGTICGRPITVDTTTPYFHQCLLAELSTPAASRGKVTFSKAAAYINTRFSEGSVIDLPAEINVRDLPDLDPAQNTRDVYLHVFTTNMPQVSASPIALDVPALEALRTQADPGFHDDSLGCAQSPSDRCFAAQSGSGICRTPAIGDQEGADGGTSYYCPYEDEPIDYGPRGFWCPTIRPQMCTLPAGGGLDSNLSALTADQKLTAEYPTYEVFPYYDSGKTLSVEGQSRKQLVPMPSFGVHAWHRGEFYGWSHTLLDAAGNPLPEVFPDVFKMTIPKASGVATIRVHVSAEEQPSAALYRIAGAAMRAPFGRGTVIITSELHGPPLDLAKATITIERLLDSDGRELVSNFSGPRTLTRLPGATRDRAWFAALGTPAISVQVASSNGVGQTVSIKVTRANVDRPQTCPGWFGTAQLTTSFTIGDGAGAAVVARGSDTWSCVPFHLLNF